MSKAYHSIAAEKDINVFIFGDHASHFIPEEFDNLGLSGKDLTRHIAWDIGTGEVVKTLCATIGCAGQIAGFSRLLIDPNRDIRMPCLIPVESDGTLIPGNRAVDETRRKARIERFHTPYHTTLNAALDKMGAGLAISIHSFTPQLDMGEPRDLEIGLLVKHDPKSADKLIEALTDYEPDWRVKINEPYSAHILNYTIDTNVSSRGMPHLAIEINQAMIDTDDKARDVATRLAKAIMPVIEWHAVQSKEKAYAD